MSHGQSEPRGLIFDIQRFCLHDGPGIRTTVFFKGCALACAWCQNPESISPKPQIAWYAERCTGCLTCAGACPKGAILTPPGQRVDFSLCDGCGACAAVCPREALVSVGRRVTASQLLDELMKDVDFYRSSGGGVTLSGGEPLLQAGFLADFLPQAREAGLHLALETSGACRARDLTTLAPMFDLLYFDMKFMDPAGHRKWTGRDNRGILAAFTRLARSHPGLVARMPVVPGIQDTDENLERTANFLKKCGKQEIHLLPYHPLGEAKIPRLAPGLAPLELDGDPAQSLEKVRKALESLGLSPLVYEPL
ncbi:MAG: glycyl-radical enzyme activating protein [Proteobacteria bacterium]|nr:glycyl-radical enzyme activating protein [Pseudomonadota bacterium]